MWATRPTLSVAASSSERPPRLLSLRVPPDALAAYRSALDLPGDGLPELAGAIGSDEALRRAGVRELVVDRRGGPRLVLWGPIDPRRVPALSTQARRLPLACRTLRYLDEEASRRLCRRLAEKLGARLGADGIRRSRFAAIPRGGRIVLGMLAEELALRPRQIVEPGPRGSAGRGPLVVVDDCAISGARFARLLAEAERPEVFAHLVSPAALRARIEAEEPGIACVAADDLREAVPEEEGREIGARWGRRLAGRRFYHGQPETVCFPWNEPDAMVWDPVARRPVRAWRIVPPALCSKNRTVAPLPVHLREEGRGRPAAERRG